MRKKLAAVKELSNLNIEDILKSEENLTFLVGAGCSNMTPSNLPLSAEFIENILAKAVPKSELDKILKLKQLTFEQVLKILISSKENAIQLIDFYSTCNKPNLEHLFLANMIKKGNFVITTNFDHLIEEALLMLEVPKKRIVPVITQKDYDKYSDPSKLFETGKLPIYKLHGSLDNLITGEDTRESFIETIKVLGINQKMKNIAQLEPFKSKFLEGISSERNLIVIGYSGKNDLDIAPTIKMMKNLNNLIWINHAKDKSNKNLKKLKSDNIQSLKDIDELDQNLIDISIANPDLTVFRIDTDTSKLIETLTEGKDKIETEKFQINLEEWINETLKNITETTKLLIAYNIYLDSNNYNDALKCLERIYSLAEDSGDDKMKSLALMNIGVVNLVQDERDKALEWFHKSLQSQIKLKDFPERISIFKNIGMINR